MSIVVACKLPHGLTIRHNGSTINLNGPNEGRVNGEVVDDKITSANYGLTTLNDADQAVFEDWVSKMTTKDGQKLAEPFAALDTGAIMSYKNEAEARKDTAAMSSMVTTGLEGLDPKKEGVEPDADAMAKSGK